MSTLTLSDYGPVVTLEAAPTEVHAPSRTDCEANECAASGIVWALALAVPLWLGLFYVGRQAYQFIAG